ncbi:MAG: hypothetical protein HKP10_06760 [Kiritimatiellales bacterium]|nr:hypothetical protein [Pontiella sp.]NNJ70974.1 hypothetical protein [Kiritimatiellales bacterium]
MKPVHIIVVLVLVVICALLTLLQPVGDENLAITIEFAGSFHPMVLHLPIGLWFGVLCILFAGTRVKSLDISNWLLWGTALVWVSGLCAYGSGIMLYLGGGYGDAMVLPHMKGALGFIAAVAVFGLMVKARARLPWLWAGAVVVSIAVGIAGHLGGVITHGHLMEKAPWVVLREASVPEPEVAPPASEPPASDAITAFDAVVLPILEEKCIFCHGTRRAKAGLTLTSPTTILSGGSQGPALIEGQADDSLMIKRILLPNQHNQHMPPIGEPQLTPEEVAVLKWWINNGLRATVDDIPAEHGAWVKSSVSNTLE